MTTPARNAEHTFRGLRDAIAGDQLTPQKVPVKGRKNVRRMNYNPVLMVTLILTLTAYTGRRRLMARPRNIAEMFSRKFYTSFDKFL